MGFYSDFNFLGGSLSGAQNLRGAMEARHFLSHPAVFMAVRILAWTALKRWKAFAAGW
jgi:hypothetical protein